MIKSKENLEALALELAMAVYHHSPHPAPTPRHHDLLLALRPLLEALPEKKDTKPKAAKAHVTCMSRTMHALSP